ncbi:MAG: DNA-binding transcriptional LysR family regulator [Paraglaciecola sp.]|jgi:DNA-binding transcriptional LysR family regulator
MKLTLDALTVLDAIERKGSFAGAAQELFRVPSTVTYTVQKLEGDLGFAIFNRVGRRSVLTPAGLVLLEQGRQLLSTAQKVVASAHQVNSGWEAELNIAIDTVWDMNKFYPLIEEFQQLNSGVQINLSEEVMGGTLEAIIEQRADITLGGPPPVAPIQGIKFEKVMSVQWLFVVAKGHPLINKLKPLTEQDTQPYAKVVIRDSATQSPIRAHRSIGERPMLRVASMEQKIKVQLRGMGVGFLPKHKVAPYLDSGELVALEIEKEAPITNQYCAWHSDNAGRAAKWFVDEIIKGRSMVNNLGNE